MTLPDYELDYDCTFLNFTKSLLMTDFAVHLFTLYVVANYELELKDEASKEIFSVADI